MPTDTDKTLNGTPEPFRRPVVWGRPPVTVFRVGPLPGGGGITPQPEAPRLQRSPGVLTGSMIPRAAPATTRPPEPPESQSTAPVPASAVAKPDLTVRPLPAAASPEPVRPVTPTTGAATAAPARIDVAFATNETAGKPAGRMALYAWIAVAALAVLVLGGWIWGRTPAVPPAPATVTEPAPVIPTPEAAPPETLLAPVVVTEPAAPSALAVPPPVRPTIPAPAPARTPPPGVVAQPPAVTTPTPVIVIAPPAPTEAERPSTDPDGPVATRPQPIG
jgi:hypothetical protein